jgi:serine/threonine protein kinase
LKPENVLIVDDGSLKIADLGLAALILPGERRLIIFAIPEYLVPEMFNESGQCAAVDLWTLGVLM